MFCKTATYYLFPIPHQPSALVLSFTFSLSFLRWTTEAHGQAAGSRDVSAGQTWIFFVILVEELPARFWWSIRLTSNTRLQTRLLLPRPKDVGPNMPLISGPGRKGEKDMCLTCRAYLDGVVSFLSQPVCRLEIPLALLQR